MARKPRHISNILQHQEILATLCAGVSQQQELLRIVRDILPPAMAPHCTSAVLAGASLTLYADSPVWSSRLRFHAPRILGHLRKQFPGIANIRIRVAAVRERRTPRVRRPQIRRSNRAAAIVARASRDITNPALSRALKQLARTLREN